MVMAAQDEEDADEGANDGNEDGYDKGILHKGIFKHQSFPPIVTDMYSSR